LRDRSHSVDRHEISPGYPLLGGWINRGPAAHNAEDSDYLVVLQHPRQFVGGKVRRGTNVERAIGGLYFGGRKWSNSLRIGGGNFWRDSSGRRGDGRTRNDRDRISSTNQLETGVTQLSPNPVLEQKVSFVLTAIGMAKNPCDFKAIWE